MVGHGPSRTADERECAEVRAAPVVRRAEASGVARDSPAHACGGSGRSGVVLPTHPTAFPELPAESDLRSQFVR